MNNSDNYFDKTREITPKEQKKLMLGILEHIDTICRKNDIKYSLIGGSLIGAIRHRGYIPWDDDIDIVLTEKNYRKLVEILDKEVGRYQTFKYGRECKEIGFRKLIDTKTHVIEDGFVYNPSYGIYVDIFSYFPLSNDKKTRKKQFDRLKFLLKLVVFYRRKGGTHDDNLIRKIMAPIKMVFSRLIGCKRINRMYENMCGEKKSDEKSKYIVCAFPCYDFDKEVQLREYTGGYVDVKFENLNVMVFKNYDKILRTTFGDYMQLPPESERIPKHCLKAWWREGFEGETEKLKKVNRDLK